MPFEKKIFDAHMKNVHYVGHPLLENKELVLSNIDYNEKKIDIGIFPGSRESEIKNNLFTMLDCIKQSKNSIDKYKNIKIFYSNETCKKIITNMLPNQFHSMLSSGKDLKSVIQCKKAITASGTITLELTLMGIPMIIVYRLSPLTYMLMRKLVKIKYIGLVNLMLGETIGTHQVVKEFIQPDYNDQIEIMVEIDKIDQDKQYREEMEINFSKIRAKLKSGASSNMAILVEEILSSNSS